MISVRAVRPGEHEALRALRLQAMTDAPEAFGATLDEEQARPESEWAALAAADPDDGAIFVALAGGRWAGLAAGNWFDRDRGIIRLWGMWVAPELRRRGVGELLVAAVREWGAKRGAHWVRIGVVDGVAAIAFYERLGFVDTGGRRPLLRDPRQTVVYMVRPA